MRRGVNPAGFIARDRAIRNVGAVGYSVGEQLLKHSITERACPAASAVGRVVGGYLIGMRQSSAVRCFLGSAGPGGSFSTGSLTARNADFPNANRRAPTAGERGALPQVSDLGLIAP